MSITDTLPSVGVVVPLYNKRATINRALASVFAQGYAPAAVVVVDDGSTDGSAEAIEAAYRTQIELLRIPNGGPGPARNAGAARCRTDLIAFLDADDAWKPDYLAQAAQVLGNASDCGAYVAAYDVGAHGDRQRVELLAAIEETGAHLPDRSRDPRWLKSYIDAMHSSSTVVRRDLFDRLGGFYARGKCLFGEDGWLWIQVAFAGPVWFDRAQRTHFHVEDSALGHARTGRHPRRPALMEPEELRAGCLPRLRRQLDRLLAYYRLLDTEGLAAHGACDEISGMRRAFPWPGFPGARMIARELRLHWRCTRAGGAA